MNKRWMNFLISIIFIEQIKKSISYNITELTIGEIYETEQPNNSLSLFNFIPEKDNNLRVFLRRNKGFPKLYGYYTNFQTELPTTVNEIIELNDLGKIDNAKNLYHTLYLEVYFTKIELIESQYTLIVLCPDETDCSYSISVLDSSKPGKLNKENQFYLIYFNPIHNMTINLRNIDITNNTYLNLYFTQVSGIIESVEFFKDNVTISPTEQVLSINDYYSFLLTEENNNSIFKINMLALSSSLFLFRYTIGQLQNEIIYVESGITQIYDISSDERKTFMFDSLSNQLIFFIKAQSCSLNIQEIDNTYVINEYHSSFYQIIYYPTNAYKIQVSLDENSNDSNCKFFVYSYEKSLKGKTIILGGSEQTFHFTKEVNKFSLLHPFFYSSNKNSFVFMNTYIPDENKVLMEIEYNDNKYLTYQKRILFGNETIILKDEIKQYCIEGKLCLLNIIVHSINKNIDFPFSIQFGASQIYCHKNLICNSYNEIKNSILLYTEVKPHEIGEIIWNYHEQIIEIFYAIIDKNNNILQKSNLNLYIWNGIKMDINEGRVKYYVNDTFLCEKGCEIYILIINTNMYDKMLNNEQIIQKNEIFISEISSPVVGEMYYSIKGLIFTKNENHTYIYTLPKSTKGFQLKLFGYHTSFYIEDLNSTHPCCENINQNYTSSQNKKFFDFKLNKGIDTTDYNIIILITVIPKDLFFPFEEQYEIELIPILYVNYPVHYFDNNLSTDCKTDQYNKCYLIIDLENVKEFYFFIPHDKKGNIISNVTNVATISQYLSHEWNDLFSIQKNETNIILSLKKNNNNTLQLYAYDLIPNLKLFVALEFDSPKELVMFEKQVDTDNSLTLMNDIQMKTTIINQVELKYISYSIIAQNSYEKIIEIMPIMGVGVVIDRFINFPIIGPTTMLINSELELHDKIFLFPMNIMETSIKLNYKIKRPYILVNLNLFDVNRIYLESEFPYIIVYQLDKNERNFILNLQIEVLGSYRYDSSNINITAGYINNNHLKELEKNSLLSAVLNQTVTYLNNRQIAVIDFSISEELRKDYEYIFFEIQETRNSNITNPLIIIEGIDKKETLPETFFFTDTYFFNYIDPTKSFESFYYIKNRGDNFTFEFSSCTNDVFELTFIYNGMPMLEDGYPFIKIEKTFINGKIVIQVYQIKLYYGDYPSFYLQIKLVDANLHHNYKRFFYGIKYSNDLTYSFDPTYTFISNLTTVYNSGSSKFNSNWGYIEDALTYTVKYSFYFFETKEYFNSSICFLETPIHFQVTTENSFSFDQKEDYDYSYRSAVIASFYKDNDQVMIGYNIKPIDHHYSYFYLWLVLIFVFVIIAFGYTTFILYKETKINKKKKNIVMIEFNEKSAQISE